jgi:hypothetical protein
MVTEVARGTTEPNGNASYINNTLENITKNKKLNKLKNY